MVAPCALPLWSESTPEHHRCQWCFSQASPVKFSDVTWLYVLRSVARGWSVHRPCGQP